MKEKLKNFLKKAVLFIANPRLLLCFGLGWMITNGWSYILFALGTWLQIGWMLAVSGAYLAFLWLPVSPEKIVTVAIAMWLLKVLFPNDEKTLGVLKNMYAAIKAALTVQKDRRAARREAKKINATEEK